MARLERRPLSVDHDVEGSLQHLDLLAVDVWWGSYAVGPE
jgi:hypothetical protein